MLFCPTACFAYFSLFFCCFCHWINKSLYKAFKEWDRAMFTQLELERQRRPCAFWCVIVACVSWSWDQWYRQGLERKPRKDPNTYSASNNSLTANSGSSSQGWTSLRSSWWWESLNLGSSYSWIIRNILPESLFLIFIMLYTLKSTKNCRETKWYKRQLLDCFQSSLSFKSHSCEVSLVKHKWNKTPTNLG